MIKFQNVSKIYPGRENQPPIRALDDVSFEVKENEFVSICGSSGAGKTTLLKMVLKEESPTQGRVFFQGKDLSQLDEAQIPKLRRKIGVVFQDYKLFPAKTVYENISYIMEVIGAEDEEIERDVNLILDIVGLKNRCSSFPNELSGGEKQRVAIARALIHRPEVILADEPTGNLDPYNTSEILKILLRIYEMGTTIVLATHNKEVINRLGRRVISLKEGRIIRDEKKGRFII